MEPPTSWSNPITVAVGEKQSDVDPSQLLPSRRDLVGRRLELQRQLIRSGQLRSTPILVTIGGVIFDGHHGVRAAVEEGRRVEVIVTALPLKAPAASILDLPVRQSSMNCPTEIARLLLDILSLGLLRLRACSSDPDRCVIEADHLHNLPAIVRSFSPSLLSYYWEVERMAYIEQSTEADCAAFQPLWSDLRPHVERASEAVSAR